MAVPVGFNPGDPKFKERQMRHAGIGNKRKPPKKGQYKHLDPRHELNSA